MSDSPPFALPCPPTPVMLYIGAGYDLSPLLSFAPGGPPYPIVPLSDQGHAHADSLFAYPHKYTSFLFVDAKPRITSAYMISDFHEWTSTEARVKNILHYAQGALSRWRTVPGAPDLLWFEGGGDPVLVESRSREPAWVFHDAVLPDPSLTSHIPHDSLGKLSSPKPLTTLLYLFNTLDIELVRAPLLAHVWPRVEALYVHGLRLHVRTGAGMVLGQPVPNARRGRKDARDVHGCVEDEWDDAISQTQLGTGLKRCYVIVGSWGTPLRKPRHTRYMHRHIREVDAERSTVNMGVRHVDFVSQAWRRWKREARTCAMSCLPLSTPSSSASSSPPLPSTPSSVSPTRLPVAINTSLPSQNNVPPSSPLIFRRPRGRQSVTLHEGWDSDGSWDSEYDENSEDVCMDWSERGYEDSQETDDGSGGGIAESTSSSSTCSSGPFHMRIPQLAWSPALRGGRGGYYIEKTVEESVIAWRARPGVYAGESEENESASDGESTYGEDEMRGEMAQKKSLHYLYILRSFFNIRAQTPPTSPMLAYPVRRKSIIPRSRKPVPPRSRPKLRPRRPTPAPDFEETDSENSASETMCHCGGDRTSGVLECERQGMMYEIGIRSERESVAFGFWRRGVPRARRRGKDLDGRVGVCDTHRMTMSMNHTAVTPTRVPSRYARNPSSKSLDTPSYTCEPQCPTSQHRKPHERRINIADFLSTTSDPNACDTPGGFSSTDTFIPTSDSDLGPMTFSPNTGRDDFVLESESSIPSSFYPTTPSALWSFSSPSLSPTSLPTTFPRSPYGPTGLFDNGNNVDEQNLIVHSRKTRHSSVLLPFWRRKTEQQHEKNYHSSSHISRTGSISGLFWRKPPMTHPQDGVSLSGLPPALERTSAHTHKSLEHHPPHNDAAAACCIVREPYAHARAPTTATTTTHRSFSFDSDAPPVPPLPSHFRGHHSHTQSLCNGVNTH